MRNLSYYMFILCYFLGIHGVSEALLQSLTLSGVNLLLYDGSVDIFHSAPIENSNELLELKAYKPNLKNWIYTPGYRGKKNGPCVRVIQQAALEYQDIWNVFLLDYEIHSNPPPLTDYGSITDVFLFTFVAEKSLEDGKKFGRSLSRMADTNKFNLSNTDLVGFSLGCHVMGAAGRELISLGKTVRQIICCDAVAKFFYNPAIYPRLNKEDAAFVQAIHTDLVMGINGSIGDADFWINYYKFNTGLPEREQVQPACPPRDSELLSPNSLCSHNFCCLLLAQTLRTYIEAGKALSYEQYKNGQIIATSGVGDKVDLSANENYYADISGCPPYGVTDTCQNPGAPLTAYCQPAT